MARMHAFHRTELLVGEQGLRRLEDARICVIGLGGVGSYAVEALARSCVGHLTLVDHDDVCVTNLNRQLHATRATVGSSKAMLMGERVHLINKKIDVVVMETFFNPQTTDQILGGGFDMVLDCIDNITAKVHLLATCVERKIPVISSMGAGSRMDPTRILYSDISQTHTDPFARSVRQLLKDRSITSGIDCVWSDEVPSALDSDAQEAFQCICPGQEDNPHGCDRRRQIQGTVAWLPSMFGLTMAGVAVNTLLGRPLLGSRTPIQHRQRSAAGKPSRERRQQLLGRR